MTKLTKEEFVKIIEEFVSLKNDEYAVHEALKKFDPDFGFFSLSRYETLLVRILESALNDKSQWISWWIYEKECGKRKKMTVSDKKGKALPSRTPGDIWELIKRK